MWMRNVQSVCLCLKMERMSGDYPVCTSSTKDVWTNGWPPAGSVPSVELTSKHSWTLTADEILTPFSQSPCAVLVFFHPGLPVLPHVGCFAKCLQTLCDTTTLLTYALLSQARILTAWENHCGPSPIEAHPFGSKRHIKHILLFTGLTCSLLVKWDVVTVVVLFCR